MVKKKARTKKLKSKPPRTGLAYAGSAVNLLVLAFALVAYDFGRTFSGALLFLGVLTCAAAVAVASGSRRFGAKLLMFSSVLLVPAGMIAIFGARRIIDDEDERHFRARRRAGD